MEPLPDNPNATKTLLSQLPLVVGISGHRDLSEDDLPKLREVWLRELREIAGCIEHQNPAESVVVLSALAAGADQLAAEVALDAGYPVYAVLPMEVEEYEKDFADDRAALERFRSLRQQCRQTIIVPEVRPLPAGASTEEAADWRDLQYGMVGTWIVKHCHVLAAFWDGLPGAGPGGTEDVKNIALKGGKTPFVSEDEEFLPPEMRKVVHIITPRVRHDVPLDCAFQTCEYFPQIHGKRQNAEMEFSWMLKEISAFNRDALEMANAAQQGDSHPVEKSIRGICPDNESCQYWLGQQKELLRFYGTADTLAEKFNRHISKLSVGIFTLLALYVVVFEINGNLVSPDLKVFGILAYLLILVLALLINKRYTGHSLETRRLDYRALAEGLRVTFWLKTVGINSRGAGLFLRHLEADFSWVRHALNTLEFHRSTRSENITDLRETKTQSHVSPADIERVLKNWVQDQASYFRRTLEKFQRKLRRHKLITITLVGIAVFLNLPLLVLYLMSPPAPGSFTAFLLQAAPVLIAALLATAAAMEARLFKDSLEERRREYLFRMLCLDRAAENLRETLEQHRKGKLSESDARTKCLTTLSALARQTLLDEEEWVRLHREVKVTLF